MKQPKSDKLEGLIAEVREGFLLYAPVLVKIFDDDGVISHVDHTVTSVGAGEEFSYMKEYADRTFVLLGENRPGDVSESVSLGRGKNCDVVVEHESVSKHHGTVFRDGESGQYTLVDEFSSNGTFVNGEPVVSGIRSVLWPGAYVSLGDATFVFIDPVTIKRLSKLAV